MAARKMMVAVDGSPRSLDALDFTAHNVLRCDTDELHLVMIRPPIVHEDVPAGERAYLDALSLYIVGLVQPIYFTWSWPRGAWIPVC